MKNVDKEFYHFVRSNSFSTILCTFVSSWIFKKPRKIFLNLLHTWLHGKRGNCAFLQNLFFAVCQEMHSSRVFRSISTLLDKNKFSWLRCDFHSKLKPTAPNERVMLILEHSCLPFFAPFLGQCWVVSRSNVQQVSNFQFTTGTF